MSRERALTIRLEDDEFLRLQAEAHRLGLRPGTVARMLVRAGLEQPPTDPKVTGALRRLRERAARGPAVDAVRLARASRAALESRAAQ